MKTKGVTFNMEDPDQAELYKFAMERKNFSGYVKRLIDRDRASRTTRIIPSQNGGIRLDLT